MAAPAATADDAPAPAAVEAAPPTSLARTLPEADMPVAARDGLKRAAVGRLHPTDAAWATGMEGEGPQHYSI